MRFAVRAETWSFIRYAGREQYRGQKEKWASDALSRQLGSLEGGSGCLSPGPGLSPGAVLALEEVPLDSIFKKQS